MGKRSHNHHHHHHHITTHSSGMECTYAARGSTKNELGGYSRTVLQSISEVQSFFDSAESSALLQTAQRESGRPAKASCYTAG